MNLDLQNFGDFLDAYQHALSFQQGGQANPQQVKQQFFQQAVQAIVQGQDPHAIFQQLTQEGMPEEQAAQIVQQAVQQAEQMTAQQSQQQTMAKGGELNQYKGGGGALETLNELSGPNSLAWGLGNTGIQGFVKGLAGATGAAAGFASIPKVIKTNAYNKALDAMSVVGDPVTKKVAPLLKANDQVINEQNDPNNMMNQSIAKQAQQGYNVFPQKPQYYNEIAATNAPFMFGSGGEFDFLQEYQSDILSGNVDLGMVPVQGLQENPNSFNNLSQFFNNQQNVQNPYADTSITMDMETEKIDSKDKLKKIQMPQKKVNKGVQYAQNTINGLAMLNQTLGATKEQNLYKQRMRDAGNTDAMASTNSYNPFGFHTVNDQNFKGMVPNTGAIQDFGTYMNTAAFGGEIEEYEEGGEYELTEAQIRHILANGGEIDFM